MATYTPRGDGLVNVDVGGGRMLAMPEAHAQAGGATLAPAATMPELPGPNPHSMIGSGEAVAGPGGGGETYVDIYGNPHLKNAPPSGFEKAVGEAWQSATAPRTPVAAGIALEKKDTPGADIYGNPLRAAPAATAPGAPTAAEKVPTETLTRFDPGAGRQTTTPQADYFGAATAPAPTRVVQTSKGGDIRASFVRKPGEQLAPGVAEYADSLDPADITSKRETAVTNAAIARDNGVAAEIDAIKAAESELEAQRSQVAQNRAALQQKLDIVDQREREAMSATPQTRREVLQSRGALAGVMSGLSIALGGWIQGLRGGENPGLKIINDSIESEISSQRAKWEAQKDKVGMARSDFGQAMQLYGDPNMAEADMRMRALTLAANMAGTYKTQGENQEWLANQQQVTQQLAAQAAGEKQKWKTLADGQVVQENYVYKPPTFATVGGPPKVTKEQKDQREEEDKAGERLVRTRDGRYVYAVSAKARDEVQKRVTAAGNLLDTLDLIESKLPKGGGATLDPDARAEIEVARDIAQSQLSEAQGQGVVTKADAERMGPSMANLNAMLSNNAAGLRTVRGLMKATHDATIRDNTFEDPRRQLPGAGSRGGGNFKPGVEK